MPFQSIVNTQQAPFVPGDFATNNPCSSIPSPQAGFVAGAAGCTVATFVWLDPADTTGRSVISSTATPGTMPLGFVQRSQQGLITAYLSEFGMAIPEGFGVTVMGGGDYVVLVTVSPATAGLKAFANEANGAMQPAAAGSIIVGYVETPYSITQPAAVGEYAIMSLYTTL